MDTTFGRGRKTSVQNPFRQNYLHIKAVAKVTGIGDDALESLVVLTGTAVFRSKRPKNLVQRREAAAYIKQFAIPRFTDAEVYAAVQFIQNVRHQPSTEADRAHRQSVANATANPECSKCGVHMVVRTAKTRTSVGQQFLGCRKFPACKGTRQL